MSILNNYKVDFPRVTLKLSLAAGVPVTLKRLILDGVKAALPLFYNTATATSVTRLALTGIVSEYLVYQTDTKEIWRFTGTDPATAGHWTLVGQSVADETAMLAIVTPPVGTIVYNEATALWFNFIGDPANHLNDDPTSLAQWLELDNEPSFTPYLYTFLKSLSWVLDRTSQLINTAAGDIFIMTSTISSGNGECPYSAAIVAAYGVAISKTGDLKHPIYGGNADKIILYSASNVAIGVDIGFTR